MKALKWIGGILGGLVLLVGLGVALVLMMLDTEQLRHEVENRFQQQTGHSLKIAAPIDWSLFPWIGLRLGDVTVGNAPGFDATPLARIHELDVKVAVMPLLQRHLAVDALVLRQVTLNLEKDAKGRPNWAGLARAGHKEVQTTGASPDSGGGDAGFSFEVGRVELNDVDLSYRDRQSGQAYQLQDLNLTLGRVAPGRPVPVQLSLKVGSERPPLQARVELNTDLTFAADGQRIDLQALAVDVAASGKGLPPEGMKLKLAADVALDLAGAGKLAVRNLSLSGPQVDVTGAVSIDRLLQSPAPDGRLQLRQTDLRRLLALAGVQPITADPKALSRFSAELAFHGKEGGLVIDPIQVTLDDSTLEGQARVLSFQGPVLRARFDLDRIDLDRYLPPPAAEKVPASQASASGEPAPTGKPVDFAPLRKLDAEVVFKVGHLKVHDLELDDLSLTFKAHKGVLSLDPVGAALYGGRLAAGARMDVRKKEPAFSIHNRITGVQVGPLLTDLTGRDTLTGTGRVAFKLTTRGLQTPALKRHLNGDFSFRFENGTYKGFNITYLVRKARAMLKGKTIPDEPQQTDFAELKATGVIQNGVVRNRDLYLASPVLRVRGEGKLDLVREQVDYLITAKIVGSLKGQGGKDIQELRGVPVPVRIRGPLDRPSPSVDLKALARALANTRLEQEKEKVLQKVEKKLQKKLGTDLAPGLLKGFLGR